MRGCNQREGVRPMSRTAGLTLIELTVSMAIVTALMLASAAAFSSNIFATSLAKRLEGAALFLETTMENVSAQPYEDLLSLDGLRVLDAADLEASNYSIDMRVFQREVDLLQVQLELIDSTSGLRTARLTTLRSRR